MLGDFVVWVWVLGIGVCVLFVFVPKSPQCRLPFGFEWPIHASVVVQLHRGSDQRFLGLAVVPLYPYVWGSHVKSRGAGRSGYSCF